MIITLYWWYLPVGLLLFPLLYIAIRRPHDGGYFGDMYLDAIVIWLVCWVSALVSLITYWISKT